MRHTQNNAVDVSVGTTVNFDFFGAVVTGEIVYRHGSMLTIVGDVGEYRLSIADLCKMIVL